MNRPIVYCGAVLGLIMLSSCATTTLKGSWSDPTYEGGPFRRIMIVGVAKREVMRKIFESNFATRLQAHGVEGVPSGSFSAGTEQLGKDSLDAKVRELGCDGVLITRPIDSKTQMTVYPATGYAVPKTYRGGYYSYYQGAYEVAYSSGYVEETTTASLETNLYDARTGNLVWTGLTETEVYDDPQSQLKELIGILVEKLAEAKLIP